MNKTVARNTIAFVAGVAVYYGFRFVTQAGQGLDVIQNDGYGGSGGVLILVGGFILGYLVQKKK